MNLRPVSYEPSGHSGWLRGGPFPDGVAASLTSPYGPRAPFQTPQGWTSDFHSGTDFVTIPPSMLCALSGGDVEHAEVGDGRVGTWLRVRADADWTWDYYHLAYLLPQIVPGYHVTAGETIGLTGSTGLSDAPHLHVQFAYRGEHVDPMIAMFPAIVKPTGRLVNLDAINAFMEVVGAMNKVVAQQDGCYIEAAEVPGGAHRDYIVRVKQ